jgi:hypothetical protein
VYLTIKIEVETLNNVKETIKRKWQKEAPLPFKTPSQLISDLLVKYKKKEIDFTDYLEIEQEKKATSLKLTARARVIYDKLPDKKRTYIINGLFREWVKINS